MPREVIYWSWEEAFSKFGFGDGESWNGTHLVADFLSSHGYEVQCDHWGSHNYMIFRVRDLTEENRVPLYVDSAEDREHKKAVRVGYDDPRKYLPRNLVRKLDEEFS